MLLQAGQFPTDKADPWRRPSPQPWPSHPAQPQPPLLRRRPVSACQVLLPQPLPANVLPLILPTVWAIGARLPIGHEAVRPDLHRLRPDFYRKYTEALLRRYIRMAMEVGKVPSLIGQDMFRGKVTSYRIAAFDDVVIFVADVDRCLQRLTGKDRNIIQYVG